MALARLCGASLVSPLTAAVRAGKACEELARLLGRPVPRQDHEPDDGQPHQIRQQVEAVHLCQHARSLEWAQRAARARGAQPPLAATPPLAGSAAPSAQPCTPPARAESANRPGSTRSLTACEAALAASRAHEPPHWGHGTARAQAPSGRPEIATDQQYEYLSTVPVAAGSPSDLGNGAKPFGIKRPTWCRRLAFKKTGHKVAHGAGKLACRVFPGHRGAVY